MASDSRVSGSEDARTPDGKGADNAPDPKANPQQPTPKDARPSEAKKGDGVQPDLRGKNATDKPTAGRPDEKPNRKPEKKQPGPAAGPAAGTPQAEDGDAKKPTSQQADATASDEPAEEQEERAGLFGGFGGNRFLLLNAVPSWVISMVLHAALLMILALLTLPERPQEERIVAISNPQQVDDVENLEQEVIDPLDVEVFEGAAPADEVDVRSTTTVADVMSMDDVSAAPEQIKLEDFGEMSDMQESMLSRTGNGTGSGLGEVRGAKAHKAMVEKFGGSKGSEAAVAAALKWIADHQQSDGGWDFDHTKGVCKGRCTHPGTIPPSRNGATAMALLPFLGAGQTHKEGQYKETVGRGLAYLVRSMKLGNSMGDLSDSGGRLYSHGLAAITLCEAYAMTNDPGLLHPAQLSLNFIVYAQDPIGGGWRYRPHQAGDTSVVGWQLMACKSGHMAYLKVPRKTILGASKFLDFVATDNGSKYGYTVPAQGPGTTAVGLLCRMYLGWKQDNSSLKAGVEYLDRIGPNNNMYYNYYATQVMRHYGGEFWESWNSRMRDRLVDSQETKGHAKGSWYFSRGAHTDRGGRLYCTSMATMILEVYYRHMPIYGKQAAEEEFPL